MMVENWFPSQLFVEDISSVLHLAKKACAGIESRPNVQKDAISNGGITTYPNDRVLAGNAYIALRNEIKKVISAVASVQNVDMSKHEVEITQLWANKMNTGSEHGIHTHSPSAYAGCLYVTCPEGSSPTRFYSPIRNLVLTATVPSDNVVNCGWVDVAPAEGRVVIWNAWLAHSVPPNESKTPRYTIAFNANINKRG